MWYVLINPTSGQGKGSRLWQRVQTHLTAPEAFAPPVLTAQPLHAVALIQQALQRGFRKFVIVGGDGTFNEGVNAIFGQYQIPAQEVTFALLPCGTGNDRVRTLGYAKFSPQALAAMLEQGATTHIDIGAITYREGATEKRRYFLNVAGLGFDTYVADRYLRGKKGISRYVSGLLRGLVNFQPLTLRLQWAENTHTQQQYEGKIFIAAMGISQYFGGGLRIAPDAITNDGLFDITLVTNISKLGVIGQLPNLFTGKFVQHPAVAQHRAREIQIDADTPAYLQIDGEVIGHTPASVSSLPQALRVICPQESASA